MLINEEYVIFPSDEDALHFIAYRPFAKKERYVHDSKINNYHEHQVFEVLDTAIYASYSPLDNVYCCKVTNLRKGNGKNYSFMVSRSREVDYSLDSDLYF